LRHAGFQPEDLRTSKINILVTLGYVVDLTRLPREHVIEHETIRVDVVRPAVDWRASRVVL
jgi:hypothetical protein